MASSVALVNKDIARHYQLANLLAPPEAIELTKLYNEMSDILSKPVKFRNQPTQLHLFYDLLSQYGKHFDNVTLEGIPKKPSTSTKPHHETKEDPANITLPPLPPDEDEMSAFVDTTNMDDVTAIAPPTTASTPKDVPKAVVLHRAAATPISGIDLLRQANAKSVKVHTPRSSIIKMLGLDKQNSDTPKKVIGLIQRNDTTFSYNPDTSSLIIHGKEISKTHFLSLLENLRNPHFKQPSGHDAFIIQKMSEAIQNETEKNTKKILEQLPGLKQYITAKPLETRASSSTNPVAKKRLEMDQTSVTSTAAHVPKKITTTTAKGTGSSRKKACAVVHWDRWKKHIAK